MQNQARRSTLAGRTVLRVATFAAVTLALGTFCYRFTVLTKPTLPHRNNRPLTECSSKPCVCPSPILPAPVVPSSPDPIAEAKCGNQLTSEVGQAPADLDKDAFIIPNVYHFVRFNQPEVTFVEMLAIKSVLRINPQLVLIHCNERPAGKFWDRVKDDRRLLLVHRDPPADIYGTKPHWVQHRADLARIQVLREYGGIYMDNDCIMLRSVDHLRKGHRCVVAKSSKEKYLGNMFFMAAMGCRFLAMYEDLYKTQYKRNLWYYNGGELPTTAILNKYPGVAHVVDEGVEIEMLRRLFLENEPVEAFSSTYDMLHTFYRIRYEINDTTDYNAVDYMQYNTSFANIARWLLDT